MENDAREEVLVRQAATNKHDKVRILHLRADPTNCGLWTAALREKTREELDNRDDPAADPWNRLAERFNDTNANVYNNAVIVPGAVGPNGLSVGNPGPWILSTLTS